MDEKCPFCDFKQTKDEWDEKAQLGKLHCPSCGKTVWIDDLVEID